MIPMHTFFLVMVAVFALIGSLRGWAKEILVAFSVFLALFLEFVLTTMIGPLEQLWANLTPLNQFWIRLPFFCILVIFGYASPSLAQRFGAKIARERLQDILLGFFLGILNGFLIVGTIWFYLDEAHYGVPPEQYELRPVVDEAGNPVLDETGQQVTEIVYSPDAEGLSGIRPPQPGSSSERLLEYLPPRHIKGPPLFLAVGLAFVFVIIVFV